MDRKIEELTILELKGVLYDLLAQQEQVKLLIQKKVQEEQSKPVNIVNSNLKDSPIIVNSVNQKEGVTAKEVNLVM